MERGPVAEALEKALFLIADKRCWTRGASARAHTGDKADPLAPYAVQWCAYGALRRFGCPKEGVDLVFDMAYAVTEDESLGIGWINDHHGHAAAVDLLADALEYAEQEGL